MADIPEAQYIQQFFALVRLSCGQNAESCLTEKPVDWANVYQVAYKQALLGVCIVGIDRLDVLTNHNVAPDMQMQMKWLAMSEKIREENENLNRKAIKLTSTFSDKGYRTVIIKGQSNFAVYPSNLADLRTPGDIDVWVDGDRKELVKFASHNWETRNLQFQHVECKIFDDTDVELHFWPMTLFNYRHDRRLKTIFNEERENCFEHHFSLTSEGSINILSQRANVMMQLAHICHHLMLKGIGLKQLLDFYMLLDSIEDEDLRGSISKDIGRCGLRKLASAISWVLVTVFHLERSKSIIPPDEKEGRFLLKEILSAGNMGHHDQRFKFKKKKTKLENYLYTTYQAFRLFRHYPSDCIWNMIYRIDQYVWRLLL